MKAVQFVVVLILVIPSVLSYSNNELDEEQAANSTKYNRKSKFFGIGIVRFANSICTTDGLDGTCYTRRECSGMDGVGAGNCAENIGVCCIVQRTCGNCTSYNNTYFVNPSFPATYNGDTTCTLTVQKIDCDICQLRIDFLSLSLAQPDGNGNCVSDALTITGGASVLPIICGENSGQHVYVNFDGNTDIVITIRTSASVSFARSWNFKIAQIACACPTLAPAGCLQYYTSLTGTVNSFNYGTTVSGGLVTTVNGTRPGTRQLVNQNYGVCIAMVPGYCSIQWSQSSDSVYSFTVSGSTTDLSVTPGLPADPLVGEMCTTDFVVIPNPIYTSGMAAPGDRFCGNQFQTVTTSSKPFVLTVVTDGNDSTDNGNRGFSLNFAQQRCARTSTATTAG